MNFIKFPANTTNIFPIANSKTGGQLLTEFNLRSRESVLTSEEVKYMIGPSYCHSMEDFKIRLQEDELGVSISSTTLEITEGRALVNGHFIESLTSVTVDLAEANKQLKSEGGTELKGRLAVGLRALYSTEQTLSASMRVENNLNLMTGIQIVILPVGQIAPGYFVIPEDSPDHEELVTAHLKLGEFYYINGQIRSIEQNENKIQAIPASRVGDFSTLLSEHYLTKDGLNPKKIYTMAGKSEDGSKLSGKPTWCDSTDSLFVWQKASRLATTLTDPNLDQAEFGIMYSNGNIVKNTVSDETKAKNDTVVLEIPHKSVDGKMWNSEGIQEYYKPRILHLPQADFERNTPGTVSADYTNTIKAINERINEFYHLPRGQQRGYLDVLDARSAIDFQDTNYDSVEEHILPKINPLWRPGDYILVRQDNTVVDTTSSLLQAPSSMYVVLPPQVSEITLTDTTPKYSKDDIPTGINGTEIYRRVRTYPGSEYDSLETVTETIASEFNFNSKDNYNEDFGIYTNYSGSVTTPLRGMYHQMSKDSVYALGEYDSTGTATPPILLEGYEGTDQYYDYQDYLTLEIQDVPILDEEGKLVTKQTWYYYFIVSNVIAGSQDYSEPILLTGTIPLATEDSIGGFYNVTESDLDNGYVYRDSNGYLKLLDYSLLRSGVLAYQLGQDFDFGSGLSTEEIQNELNEYVNERVAFPTEAQIEQSLQNGTDPNCIQINLNLSEEDAVNSIDIKNIDSRWGTYVNLLITGSANSNTTINISNCEKIKISLSLTLSDYDLESGNGPVINLYNCGLYYDASVIDYIHNCNRLYESNAAPNETIPVYKDGFTGIDGLSIWYEKLESDDPNLVVDGMSITEIDTPIIPEDIDFWNEAVINDNHYYYGLQGITLDPNGNIVSCGIYIRNDMSANIEFGKTISVSEFILPQGSGFSYPKTSLIKQLKITGDFVTCYSSEEPAGYITMSTQFTALTQRYTGNNSAIEKGTISFLSSSEFIDDFISISGLEQGVPIDGWESNSYHVFKGWTIG